MCHTHTHTHSQVRNDARNRGVLPAKPLGPSLMRSGPMHQYQLQQQAAKQQPLFTKQPPLPVVVQTSNSSRGSDQVRVCVTIVSWYWSEGFSLGKQTPMPVVVQTSNSSRGSNQVRV